MLSTQSFQLRLVRWVALTLGTLSLLTLIWFPLRVGFEPVYFTIGAASAMGFAGSALLARRGYLHSAANLVLVVATVALAVGVTYDSSTDTHHLLLPGFAVPVLFAFLLDRLRIGVVRMAATVVLLVAHAAGFPHTPGQLSTIGVVFMGISSIGGLDALLRPREHRRAETAEIESRRLREFNEMRMQFINTAAHDLRTPLTPLKLAMATLRTGNQDQAKTKPLEMMQRSISRFEMLIEDMLDAARLQAGRVTLKRKPIDLAPIVLEGLQTFEEAARQGGLTIDAGGVKPAVIDADPLKASQVVMNLLQCSQVHTTGRSGCGFAGAQSGACQVRGAGHRAWDEPGTDLPPVPAVRAGP